MLSRYLKDDQRHEMLACNCTNLPRKRDIRAVGKDMTKILPELVGVGAWCWRQ